MTLTPLHVAFVWMLKPQFRKLHFAALTIGAVIPDIEPLVTWAFGWSVFCGWDFPCSLAPDRLVLHSIVGALTVDVALTMIFVKMIEKLGVERLGINGFSKVRVMSAGFYASAAIGALSHVLVDWLHHPANPIFFPLAIDDSYYVGGLLLPFLSVLHASLIVAIISGAILVATIVKALGASGQNLSLLFSNPKMALSLVTDYLSKT